MSEPQIFSTNMAGGFNGFGKSDFEAGLKDTGGWSLKRLVLEFDNMLPEQNVSFDLDPLVGDLVGVICECLACFAFGNCTAVELDWRFRELKEFESLTVLLVSDQVSDLLECSFYPVSNGVLYGFH